MRPEKKIIFKAKANIAKAFYLNNNKVKVSAKFTNLKYFLFYLYF